MPTKINQITQSVQNNKNNKVSEDIISIDAPPLDFSFKNIKHISQIKDIQPRQGQKTTVVHNEQSNKVKKQQKQQIEKQQSEDEEKGQKKKSEIIKLLPQNNINNVVNSLVNNSAMKNISLKAKQQLQKKKKKNIHVKLVCVSLMLGYNKIRQISGLSPILSTIMQKPQQNLLWIDLSHNYLTRIEQDFKQFPKLKTLYLHCNFIADMNQLQKLKVLQELKTMTIHGNPLSVVPNFRLLTVSILSNLKKLDSVLISKKQIDNAIFIRSQTKKYPVPKNPAQPPVEKKEDQQQQKQ